MNELFLDVARQRHREPVHVDLVDVEAFGFEVDLVPLPIGKPHDLVFERRAIPRADALNLAVVERTAIEVGFHQFSDTLVRVKQPASDLITEAAAVVANENGTGDSSPHSSTNAPAATAARNRCFADRAAAECRS